MNIPESQFVKMSQDPRLVAVDKLVRSHAPYPGKKAEVEPDWSDPEVKSQYDEYCKTRKSPCPVIGEKVKAYIEYKQHRESLRQYVELWKTILDTGCGDVRLFTL